MSHRTPSKTDFSDEWRDKAACLKTVSVDPSLRTAWDNIDNGTWEKENYEPDPQSMVARQICHQCPVRRKCLEDALSDNEATGLRAGYRFDDGYVTKDDARKIYAEYGLRARVRKNARTGGVRYEEDQEMPRVSSYE